MKHSDAVAAAIEQWCERMTAGDVEGVAATLVDDPEAFAIGTQRIGSGRESWLGEVAQMARMGVAWRAGNVRAWETADAGFAAGELAAELPDGMILPMRVTAFLARDGGMFRIFNIHFSWAVPDDVGIPQAAAWRAALA